MAGTPRLIIICEGKSEQNFVNYAVKSYLQGSLTSWQIKAQLLGAPFRLGGGNPTYVDLRDHIKWVLEQYPNAFITTFLDYYELGKGFGLGHLSKIKQENITNDIYLTVECLEEEATKKLANDIAILNQETFIPYIQLHEFEMLYYANLDLFCQSAPSPQRQKYLQENIRPFLEADLVSYNNPEAINSGEDTAPSKRIIKNYKKFAQLKVDFARGFGAQCIKNEFAGVECIREKCPHFNAWLETLQRLDQ